MAVSSPERSATKDPGGEVVPKHTSGGCSRLDLDTLEPLADEQLFALYQQGNEAAFEVVYRRFYGRIFGFIRKRLGDEDRVEDLVQDTFLRVHRARASYEPDKSLSTWIHTIAANLLKNEYRNRKRRVEVSLERSVVGTRSYTAQSETRTELVDPNPRPDDQAYAAELREAITRTLSQLRDHHRLPLLLKETGHTFEEIAERMEIVPNTAKSRVIRARSAFRAKFPLAA